MTLYQFLKGFNKKLIKGGYLCVKGEHQMHH